MSQEARIYRYLILVTRFGPVGGQTKTYAETLSQVKHAAASALAFQPYEETLALLFKLEQDIQENFDSVEWKRNSNIGPCWGMMYKNRETQVEIFYGLFKQ